MTDFLMDSAWTEPESSGGADFRETTRPAPIQAHRASRPSRRAQRRPAAALAANVKELLDSMTRKRVPRLDAVRMRLQQARPVLPLTAIEDALHALHAATTALDFLAGRSGGERSREFLRQGEALGMHGQRLVTRVGEFREREAVLGPMDRLTWIDLVMESASLRKRVRQGAHWLAEMDQDLLFRRRAANTDVTMVAIDELARRAMTMHARLHAVHLLCSQARKVHAASEQLAAERSALSATLHDRVLPAVAALEDAVQPLLHAAAYRALVPTELVGAIDACHELQVMLTQAAAQIVRLHEMEQGLVAQLAQVQEKVRLVTG